MQRESLSDLQRPIPAAAYAEQRGIPESAVVSRIRRGLLDGVQDGDVWYVEDRATQRRQDAMRAVATVSSPEEVPSVKPETRRQRRRREEREALERRFLRIQAMPYWKRVLYQIALCVPAMFAFHLKAQAADSFYWAAPILGLIMLTLIVWDGIDTIRRRSKGSRPSGAEDV
ncbi:MAG: hypothetical protein AAGI52_15285 [Bacteroidota bacterium]